jgi:hypothetical protein
MRSKLTKRKERMQAILGYWINKTSGSGESSIMSIHKHLPSSTSQDVALKPLNLDINNTCILSSIKLDKKENISLVDDKVCINERSYMI